MGINKKLLTSSKEEILQALAPLNQHVLDNRERFLKALTQRDYIIDEEGCIRWSPFLLSGKIKEVDKEIAEKVKKLDLIYKSKEFMDKIEYSPLLFQLEIKEFCDGFQVNLLAKKNVSAKKDVSAYENDDVMLGSTSYFVWKSW